MARTNQLSSAKTRNKTLALRTRDSTEQNDTITPPAKKLIPTQADQCPIPGLTSTSSHQHSKPEDQIPPPIDQYRKADDANREQWSEEQRRRIAENEAVLRQLAEIEPNAVVVGGSSSSPKTHLPRGNDLTVQEQINIIHGGATPEQYAVFREMLLEQQRQDMIDNTSPISPVLATDSDASRTESAFHNRAEQQGSVEWDDFPELDAKYGHSRPSENAGNLEQQNSLEWDDFPELDAKYGHPRPSEDSPNLDPRLKSHPKPSTSSAYNNAAGKKPQPTNPPNPHHPPRQNTAFLNTSSLLCTGPCPLQTPHSQGPYLQRGQVPRTWNPRWGYSDPPREIWEAWARIERGCGRSWDRVQVDGFAVSHWWGGV